MELPALLDTAVVRVDLGVESQPALGQSTQRVLHRRGRRVDGARAHAGAPLQEGLVGETVELPAQLGRGAERAELRRYRQAHKNAAK
jgi:hypothetical protein